MKNIIFWAVTPFCMLEIHLHFGRTYRLHHQGQGVSDSKYEIEAYSKEK
jgi:hypothetical protein